MKAFKFDLKGKTAFFKQPDVNTYLYFSYGQIHRIALLGIFGAIMGYSGYSQNNRKEYPEFYKKFMDLKIAVIPNTNDGIFNRKIQRFNNSTAFASREEGGNLIVKQVWLEDVSWTIYFLIDNEEAEKLSQRIINYKVSYIPYLGTNDHFADILNPAYIDLKKENVNSINSMFLEGDFKTKSGRNTFRYQEFLPFKLEKNTDRYIVEKTIFTDQKLIEEEITYLDKENDKSLVFYSEEGLYGN